MSVPNIEVSGEIDVLAGSLVNNVIPGNLTVMGTFTAAATAGSSVATPVTPGTGASFTAYNNADITNASYVQTRISGSAATLNSGSTGTGTALNLVLQTGNPLTTRLGIDPSGNILIGAGPALATTATNGFFHMNTCAGAPTGVPTSFGAATVPMIVDTTDSKLYLYIGGVWKSVTFS